MLIMNIVENECDESLTKNKHTPAATSGASKIMRPSHPDVSEMRALVAGSDYNRDNQPAHKANNYEAENSIAEGRKESDKVIVDKNRLAERIPKDVRNNSYCCNHNYNWENYCSYMKALRQLRKLDCKKAKQQSSKPQQVS
jgi:hypothetical protein